ncbi:phosphate signaling complex protein PhoU [Conexibacter sp. CPCC 206217]|uniref:phosphate signaling complex protein PhoU n=1 Tax=Conexibacter sp. CPCC 206217 TaxID=3064574 RepID=UPI00271A5DFE|nr:phosphate signaling complex protein PhoU [Conexibacter sp. CPCC 206217]MDO8211666.1 phosphate signaling complex protein PhoU [Conexibacter sp. CPCC 206217]
MRSGYCEELAEIERRGLDTVDLAVEALDRVLEALALRDADLARAVVAGDDLLDERCRRTQREILTLMARQAPVASDLRTILGLIDFVSRIERVGDQCVTIAKFVALDGREAPADTLLLDCIALMGRLVREQLVLAKRAFATRDVPLAEQLPQLDQRVNLLNREVFQRGIEIGGTADVRRWAMHMTLAARCLERIGDNAVDVGERVVFVATGRLREFSDASHVNGGKVAPRAGDAPG